MSSVLSNNNNRSYIAVHDDARIISSNERQFRTQTLRSDGREPNQHRPVQLHLTRTGHIATATVRLGNTRATASVTAQLVAPSDDRPHEGITTLAVELSPMAATSYRAAAPLSTGGNSGNSALPNMDRSQRLQTNPILRAIERCWDAALDTEALCVVPGQVVWQLMGSITVLCDDGNCLDAAVLASVAALKHYRQPVVDVNATPPSIQMNKEPTPLPLHVTPLAMTFGVWKDTTTSINNNEEELRFWVDPTGHEELCCVATLSLALTIHGQLCWWTYAGHEIHLHQLRHCHDTAAALLPELSRHIQQALESAEERALQERIAELPPLPPPNVPYLVEAPEAPVEPPTPVEEEAYRKQALDYNIGHVSAKVRGNDDDDKQKKKKASNTKLLAALFQSVASNDVSMEEAHVVATEEESKDDAITPPPYVPKASLDEVSKMMEDSDEEEVTTQLQTEFQPDVTMKDPPLQETEVSGTASKTVATEVAGDLDLTAAIKKGKKKKKKR